MSETVEDLKHKIKEKKPNSIYFDASLLKLYLAREGDKWLNSKDEAMKAIKPSHYPVRIKNLMQEHLLLDAMARLDDDAYFGKNFQTPDGVIHVLVEYPREDELDGSFLENWFSWHFPWSSLQSLFSVEKEKRA
ncbi:hypothetical protein DVH05_001113 [Phytophthora capsici]|nr:hypothetical protein DVH05_001113 [Phytophthora capsici]